MGLDYDKAAISLKFVPMGLNYDKPTLVQIMVLNGIGDKPLSARMMA